MKIRQGFVSNSSSSSFLVKIPIQTETTINSVEDIAKHMKIQYDDELFYENLNIDFNNIFDNGWSVIEVDAEYGSEEDVYGVLNQIFGKNWNKIYRF